MRDMSRITLIIVALILSFMSNFALQTSKITSSSQKTYTISRTEQQHASTVYISTESLSISSLSWQRQVNSTHFVVNYNISGSDAVTDEYAQNISYSLEHSWTTEVNNYGFSQPPNFPITVYIMDIYTKGKWGETGGSYSRTGYHVDNITLDKSMNNIQLMQYVCAHEFFHAIQLSYSITAKWFIENTTAWIIEGTAVWMGARVYPDYTGTVSYLYYADEYLANPDRTITELGYDSVLFWIFVDEHYGGTDTIKNIMQQNENMNGIGAVNATLNTKGTTFTKVFKEWTIANYLKNSHYTKGYLFNSVYNFSFTYDGERWPLGTDVADWGADYYEVSSSVIFMPIRFQGGQHHNLTKILIEHGRPLISDFVLSVPYAGNYSLMQANNLDKILIIVRALGTETSNNKTAYTLTFLSSSQTLHGPYAITSAQSNIYVRNDRGTQASPCITAYIIGASSSQSSPQINATVVADSSYVRSSAKQLYTINGSGQQNSALTPLYTLNNTSSQDSSTKYATVVNDSSNINSSQMPVNVTLIHDVAVTNVASSKTIVGQGFNDSIKVTVVNQGSYTEIFNVTVYANTTAIATQTVTLASRNSTTITFKWNTASFAKGTYIISAYASPVPGETYTADNLCVDGTVQIYVRHGGGPGAKNALLR